ncbi:sigma-70 family RNA polymerase sigma factor [Nocardia huaxiensis]|uniref:sigma-70 family RNA polymerase sigma factor n=1 Tax=Nocardia huaxiensis TaxID=2755382 RepID=UPI001E50E070|nr:sigma-70 family RNA polymerase sigma factor [Nocardia huaxiensis]UFS94155.1 sigma-70 family RNA polymerase sigma factor [Nocardia huaxiensis]
MLETEDFTARTAPYRRELLAHCYRMLGSVDDTEDLVQETMLRAWRGYPDFQERASMRTWLYRIATNACLNALEHSSRRELQPMPDVLVEPEDSDPAAILIARHDMRLALIALWQHLPPRQRAVLLLRDVLRWRATEVAELLDVTPAAVNSTLQRAHATLANLRTGDEPIAEPDDPATRAVLDSWAAAFESSDTDTLTNLLRAEAVWEMPPIPGRFTGRDSIIRLITTQCPSRNGGARMIPTRANGQPAFALYLNGEAHSIQVLTVTAGGIASVVAFHGFERFEPFGLPKTL